MGIFSTVRKESFETRVWRYMFNIFPAYRRTSGRVRFISSDWREVQVSLKLSWKTRNNVGAVFGGSIYGALDPVYMLQLMKILGKNYVVWDKSATVNFLKPVKTKVYAQFLISEEDIEEIKANVIQQGRFLKELKVTFIDSNNISYAEVSKVLYVANKNYYKNRREKQV